MGVGADLPGHLHEWIVTKYQKKPLKCFTRDKSGHKSPWSEPPHASGETVGLGRRGLRKARRAVLHTHVIRQKAC
eukprot:1160432-Pelagomonas_calceolata.AAC.2